LKKKYIQFGPEHIEKIATTYHNWQQQDKGYEDVPEYCYSAHIDEIEKKDYSLVPSKYIEFKDRDENIDFDEKMTSLKSEFENLLQQEAESKEELLNVFKELGFEIKL
jgi:type I restriction enzyme M protein